MAELKPHPRNYRKHPEDQLEHLCESIRANGVYRNIAIARDSTILAGHGVAKACAKLGMATIPVLRLDLDPDDPKALKLLAGDNEISNLAVIDDRLLTELLKEIRDVDIDGLIGTGLDDAMLANLIMVSRPKSEIEGIDEASEWVGMPEFDTADKRIQLIVTFKNEEDREQFSEQCGAELMVRKEGRLVWSGRWPPTGRRDLSSSKFV